MAAEGGARFARYLESRRPQIDAYLSTHIPLPQDAADRVAGDLVSYLYEPLARFTANGGKRTRPALCLLGAEAVGADPICALSAAGAVEGFQSAALIHDDIADQGQLRRGKPCLHLTDGVGVAMNVGDLALVSLVAGLLEDSDLDNDTCLRLLCEITFMEQRTLEGQALDLGWVRDGRWNVTVDSYRYMATHKTAYYSAATPLACGAICGKGTDEQVEALFAFGLDAGLAFQLQDDLLNLVGSAEALGKDFRSDITEGKRTMVALHALSVLEGAPRERLQALLSSGTTDEAELAEAVTLMEEAGSVAYVREEAHALAEQAKRRLEGVELADEARLTLLSMADFFVERLG